ncbi:type II secretion system protein GspJ [Rheinheimera sp. D18]|uniref:type II secretion system minor pseudopilin GspJ n=1 Tax=Rheinheimera sp. D18 TaxID=2545632 RepID=UPI0010529887|nr:type II secretion system minor pseudopilin GspJ [Rheinheimera sp. D18]QBL10630.1 type II secretion system protein GspJ [Rheinheimera sp. D18]
MYKLSRGFTFIEMLLAAAIFALIGLASVAVLSSVTQSDELSKLASERLVQLQRTMLMLERDFMQMSVRHVRIAGEAPAKYRLYGEKFLLDSEDHGVSFARQGWRNPGMILPRSEIQAVAYRLQEGTLQRLFTLYPDAVTGTEPKVQLLQTGLTGFTVQYLQGDEWLERWQDANFPAAVRITLVDESLGNLVRVFLLPDAVVAEKTH